MTTMKTARIRLSVLLTLAVAATFAAAPANAGGYYRGHAHGPRVVFGFSVGAPWGYPYAYPYYPYYPAYGYYPAPVVVQQQPSVYVERPQVEPSQPAAGYWYYCADSRAYYPYVKECPAGWQRVAPRPQD